MATKKNPSIIFEKTRKVVVKDLGMPQVGDDDVLVRTSRTLISTGTELAILNGETQRKTTEYYYGKFPFQPGYDNVGVIEAVGKNVAREWIGRKVATYGTHSQFVTSRFSAIRPVNWDIPDEEATFFTIAEIVMNGIRRGGIQWGESVAVFGLGLLGQIAVRLCQICGARPVFAVDTAVQRLARLPQDAGIVPVNPSGKDLRKMVQEATRGRMADVVIELTGNPDAIPGEFDILRPLGRFVLLSSPRDKTLFHFGELCNSRSCTIIGAHNCSHPPVSTPQNPWSAIRHAELFFDLIASGDIKIAPLISHRAPYSEAAKLYGMLLKDRSKAMGVVLEWD